MEMYNDGDEIKKIRFDTDTGEITWKPKVSESDYVEGIKRIKSRTMKISDLPEKLKDLGKTIAEKGKVKLKVSYMLMTKEVDGIENKYRYITSIKAFESWEIL